MEIQGRPGDAKASFDQQQRALIDANRALVRAAREDLAAVGRERSSRVREHREQAAQDTRTSSGRDELVLSRAAVEASELSTAEREARVRELAEEHRMERLHTPERIERAAQRLLEG